jgi:phosphatidylinositol glycan class H protein
VHAKLYLTLASGASSRPSEFHPTSRILSFPFRILSLSDALPITMAAFLDKLTSPPAQTLQILQPTSYTITYTVSTRPVPSTLPAKALWYIGILLRVLLGFTTLLALWAKWSITESQSIEYLRAVLGSTEKEAQLIKFIATCSWIYLAPCAAAVLFLVFRRGYTGTSL